MNIRYTISWYINYKKQNEYTIENMKDFNARLNEEKCSEALTGIS